MSHIIIIMPMITIVLLCYCSCQGNVDQQFDIFVVKIHTTKLSNGNPKKHRVPECDFTGVFEDLKKVKVLDYSNGALDIVYLYNIIVIYK